MRHIGGLIRIFGTIRGGHTRILESLEAGLVLESMEKAIKASEYEGVKIGFKGLEFCLGIWTDVEKFHVDEREEGELFDMRNLRGVVLFIGEVTAIYHISSVFGFILCIFPYLEG